jgi:hypothetical protein
LSRGRKCIEHKATLDKGGNLYQTNVDNWKPDDQVKHHDILMSIERRQFLKDNITPIKTPDQLIALMNEFPINNRETVYLALMIPHNHVHVSFASL